MSHRKLFDSSNLSKFYAATRPKPCPELIQEVIGRCSAANLAVDVGCGTGQVTSLLAPFFKRVLGFDASQTQIDQAIRLNQCQNVEYRVGISEHLNLDSNSVDLITCSQALHWLDIPASLATFRRLLTGAGVFVAITYVMPFLKSTKNLSVDEEFIREKVYKHEVLKDYWNWQERKYIDSCYETIDFSPFNHVERQVMAYSTKVPLVKQADYVNQHLHSWSPFQKLVKEDGEKAKRLVRELLELIPPEDEEDRGLILEYPYTIVLAYKQEETAKRF